MPKQDKKIIKRRLVNAYLSSVISISMVLLLIAVASLILINSRKVANYLKENVVISVLLVPDADEIDAAMYANTISMLPYISETKVISKEEGQKELAAMLGEDFLSVFEASPVPVSVDLTLKADYVSSDSLAFILPLLEKSSLVDEIESRQGLVMTLNENLTKISIIFGVLIVLLMFISVALINNMIRLSVFARRFTIHTMKLVGATKNFIRAPFMRSALLQAFIAALLSSAALWGLYTAACNSFAELFSIFDQSSLWICTGVIFASGLLICELSTFFVVGKLVGASKDDLYY